MKVLVLGATGMLGHKLCQELALDFEVYGTVRGDGVDLGRYEILDPEHVIGGTSSEDIGSISRAIQSAEPDVVINGIGAVKQTQAGSEWQSATAINSVLPHNLALLTQDSGARLISVSTDCVFSGRRGNYRETDIPDAEDPYGVSKRLGEPRGGNVLVLRTSIIGRELRSSHGLLEWFLSNRGSTIQGYVDAIFSGLTTVAFARLLRSVIMGHPELSGLYHVSSEPISKYDLLVSLNTAFATKANVLRSSRLKINRSLDSSVFRAATGWRPSGWDEMIAEMTADPTPYERWRGSESI
jgi:dTDP-4-dehydrorhamnose reductase